MKHLVTGLSLSAAIGIGSVSIMPSVLRQPANAAPAFSFNCGPAHGGKLSTSAGVIWNSLLYPWSRIFDSSCAQHDKDYDAAERSSNAMSQKEADNKFLKDMQHKCRNNWKEAIYANNTAGEIATTILNVASLGIFSTGMKAWCLSTARANYEMVSNLAEDIGSIKAFPSIKVTSAKIKRIDDYFSDDEIEVRIQAVNDGNVNIEVDAVMMKKGKGFRDLVKGKSWYSPSGWASALNSDVVDTEPDTHEKDLKSGESWSEKLTTNGVYASQEDLSNPVDIFIRSDLFPTGPFVPMAWIRCNKPKPGKTAECGTIQYRFGDSWSNQTVQQHRKELSAMMKRNR